VPRPRSVLLREASGRHAAGARLVVLDQLFHSLTLLTSPAEDDQSEAMLSREELDELLTLTDVPAWLEQMGATEL